MEFGTIHYRFIPKCFINVYLYVLKNSDMQKVRVFEVIFEMKPSLTEE
jgi:hypothetical protein